mmetsp:Transcript_17037/g.12091  ORF Transcript_17037/g.12091 Transcript_17037/m.12091 type:complete len:97 (-) Transcript_17037:517-807(-)
MKQFFTSACLVAILTQSTTAETVKIMDEPVPLSDDIPRTRVAQNSWNGFVTGLYKKKEPMLTDDCFGDWIVSDLLNVRDIVNRFSKGTFSVSYEEA